MLQGLLGLAWWSRIILLFKCFNSLASVYLCLTSWLLLAEFGEKTQWKGHLSLLPCMLLPLHAPFITEGKPQQVITSRMVCRRISLELSLFQHKHCDTMPGTPCTWPSWASCLVWLNYLNRLHIRQVCFTSLQDMSTLLTSTLYRVCHSHFLWLGLSL